MERFAGIQVFFVRIFFLRSSASTAEFDLALLGFWLCVGRMNCPRSIGKFFLQQLA